MLDFTEPLWLLAMLVLAVILCVCVVCTIGLAGPATARAARLQHMANSDDAATGDLRQARPEVMSPWRPGIALFLAVWLVGLAFWQGIRDPDNRTKWMVMVVAGGGGLVWAIGLVNVSIRMAFRIGQMYGG